MMKHLPKLLSVILLLSLLTGCDNSRPATTVPETTMVPTTAAPETTVAPTTAPISTTAPTTVPVTTIPPTTEPLNVYCDLPEFTPATDPTTLPADPVLSDLVTTGYTGSACWKDLSGGIETPTFSLPSVTPFCEGAIAINREIAEIFDPILEKARDYFDQKVTAMEAKISYEASLSGDILTILITTDTFYDYHRYHTFAIDIATGQRLDQQALVSRVLHVGYAEFLYRATYTAYDHLSQKGAVFGSVTDGFYVRSYQLYLAEDGTPMICNPRPGELYDSIELPYNPAAQGEDPNAATNEYYRWLFRLQPSDSSEWFAQEFWYPAWAKLLKTFFDHDSVKMLRYLATEDAACVDKVISCLCKAVTAQQQESFTARCRELSPQEDPTVAQLARKLLDALEAADAAFVRVTDHIPNIFIDLRYATESNFTGQAIYDFRDAYLRYGTVKKLIAVQNELRSQGLILKIWDAFRPTAAQFRLWEVCPDPSYVADPTKGFSDHSRGNTLDITLCYADGTELKMPTGFDDFSALADRDYSDCAPEAAANAKLLESIMTKHGFTGYAGEWWHYSDTTSYDEDETFFLPVTESPQEEQARYLEAFRQVDENSYEGEAGQTLHDLCFEDVEKFLHYASQVIDPDTYDYQTSSAWHSYKWAVYRNATDAQRALMKETCLAAYRDTQNSFELRYCASFFAPLDRKEELAMRAEVLESHTEIEFQAYAAIIDLNETGYVPQYYPAENLFTSYEQFHSYTLGHKEANHYDSTFTNDLSPQSYDTFAAQFDKAFFENHILLRAEVDVKAGDLPTVTKVTTGEPCYWMDRFCVYMEYTDGTSNMANPIPSDIWVVFIAVPRKHYAEPIGINDYQADFNFCINGIPFQNYG